MRSIKETYLDIPLGIVVQADPHPNWQQIVPRVQPWDRHVGQRVRLDAESSNGRRLGGHLLSKPVITKLGKNKTIASQ